MKWIFYSRILSILVLSISVIFPQATAKTIKSTAQGGNWHSPSTWVGGQVPGKEDHVEIESKVYLNTTMTEQDSCLSLTISKTGSLLSLKGTLCNLAVTGQFINFGTVKKENDDSFILQLSGDIMNYGKMEDLVVAAFLEKKVNRVTGIFDCLMVFDTHSDSADIHFLVIGKADYKKLITVSAKIIIDGDADMKISEASFDGIINAGNLISTQGIFRQRTIRNFQSTYFDPGGYLNLKFADLYGSCNNPALVTYGSECHPRMKSSVCRWWRLSPGNQGDTIDPCILELHYDDALLNGINETELHVYLSKDEGVSWQKISNSETIVRNTEDNIITIGNEENPVRKGGGDIVLAAGEDDIMIPPSVSVSIIGPDDIRIGAPNRYRIAYWNNGTVNTGTFFLKVKLEGGIEMDKMISHYPNDITPVEFSPEEIHPNGDKTYGFFLIDGLGSKEYSSFDLILNCLPDELKSAKSPEGTTALPVIAAVGLYIGAGIVADYVSDVIVGSCYEIVFNDNTTVMDAAKNIYNGGVKKTNAKYTIASPVKAVASNVVMDIATQIGHMVLWPADLMVKFWNCLDDIAEGLNEANAKKNPRKVNSWDPNAKYGPSGYGEKNFMAQASPMIYMIKFENLKDATAAAYRIVVTDSLNPEIFDIGTVDTLGMSHNSGRFSVEGNKLTWEFVEIELPPNKNPPEGEGWVSFKVNLKEGLLSGTQIKNKAVITFDLNKPIETNETINTLDFNAPSTQLQDFPPYVSDRSVILKWSASDGSGSGIDMSYVYSSVNNGPFSLIGTEKGNEKKLDVFPGNDYRFFVLSKDNVGNTETQPVKIVSTRVITNLENRLRNEYFKIFPNPAANRFVIQVESPSPGETGIAIFDMLGNKIWEKHEKTSGNQYSIPVNLVHTSPGLYLVKLRISNREYSEKLMIR